MTTNPNLHKYWFPVKSAIVPTKEFGHDTFVMCDFSAQEVRVAALLSHDEQLLKTMQEGTDVHKYVASLSQGIPIEEVDHDQRKVAKSTTFGILYGKGVSGLADDLGMTEEEAQGVFDKYFEAMPKFKNMIDEAQAELDRQGYIEIPSSGGRRNIKDVWSKDFGVKQGAYRKALNTKIQGGSAHISRTALILIQDAFDNLGLDAKLVVTVHDSFVASCKKEHARTVSNVMQYIMENLPLDFFNTTIDGKQTVFHLEAEPTISTNYNNELDMTDDYEEFDSIFGYYEYYRTIQIYDEELEQKIITEEEHDDLIKMWHDTYYEYLKHHDSVNPK